MAQKIRIIGVPMDLGASRRGVDMGPSALRVAGLQARIKQLGHQVEDIGNISVKQPEEMSYGEKRAKYIAEICEACKDLGTAVQKSLDEGYLAARSRWRPLHCRRLHQRRRVSLPQR